MAKNDGYPSMDVIVETIKNFNSQNAVGDANAADSPVTGNETPQAVVPAPEQEFFQSELHLPAPENPNQIGPFGWIGVVFLLCLFFACVTNIYLNHWKKRMESVPAKEELDEALKSAKKA